MNIVIVDDNVNTTNTIKEILLLEFNQIKVHSYNKIMKIEKDFLMRADFLIMDYNLEEKMNGVQLTEKIVDMGYVNNIIFITGENKMIVKTKLKLSGIKNYYFLDKDHNFIRNLLSIINDSK